MMSSPQDNEYYSNIINDKGLRFTGDHFDYLSRFPDRLLYLLVTDFIQFYKHDESWLNLNYGNRGHGSVADLLNTLANMVLPAAQSKEPITLEYIQKLHASACSKIEEKDPGFRTYNNCFPVSQRTMTESGLQDLIEQTRKRNYSYYGIGKLHNLYIFNTFLGNLKNKATLKEAIETTVTDFKKMNIAEEDVRNIINAGNENPHFLQQIENHTWLSDAFNDDSIKQMKYFSQCEYDFYVNYSKEHAVNIAKSENVDPTSIYNKIKKQKHYAICLFPPNIDEAKKLAEESIQQFNIYMQTPNLTDREKITAIGSLVHELEILHLFPDGNLRTMYLLLNQLLMTYGFKYSILYDPNRLDGYSKAERTEQIIQGISRFERIVNNADELIGQDALHQKKSFKARSDPNNLELPFTKSDTYKSYIQEAVVNFKLQLKTKGKHQKNKKPVKIEMRKQDKPFSKVKPDNVEVKSFEYMLNQYSIDRTQHQQTSHREYKTIFGGIFGGIKASVKISAATKLLSMLTNKEHKPITTTEIEALCTGDLWSKIVSKHKNSWPDEFKKHQAEHELKNHQFRTYQMHRMQK